MTTLKDLKKRRTATLRKMAKKQGIPNWEKAERKDLLLGLLDSLTTPSSKAEEQAPTEEMPKEKEEELRVVAPGVEEQHVPVGSKAELMRARLAKQPKVRVLIPLIGEEKSGTTMSVILNGYRLNVAKGVYVDVPEQVADVIMESQKQTVKALEHPLKIKGSKPELDA